MFSDLNPLPKQKDTASSEVPTDEEPTEILTDSDEVSTETPTEPKVYMSTDPIVVNCEVSAIAPG